MKKLNRKGSIVDVLFIVVMMFVLALVFLLATSMYTNINNSLQSSDTISDNSKTILSNFNTKFPKVLDNAFVFILAGLILAVLIGGFLIRDHPAFFFVAMFMLIFFVALSAIFANVYHDVANSEAFSASAANYPKMQHIMNNFPVYAAVFGGLIIIILYAKPT